MQTQTAKTRLQRFVRNNPTANRISKFVIREIASAIGSSYQAASRGRRGFRSRPGGPNTDILAAQPTIQRNSIWFYNNTAHGRKAIECLTSNICGSGMNPRISTGDTKKNKKLSKDILKLWKDQNKKLNADGSKLNGAGMQILAAKSFLLQGEVFLRYRPRKIADALPVPFQVEILEAPLCDISLNKKMKNAGRIVNGVQLDRLNRIEGYHILEEHPDNNSIFKFNNKSHFVASRNMSHLYIPSRPGQRRGMPWMLAGMTALKDLEDYKSAERLRKKIEATLVAFVSGGQGDPDVNENSFSGDLAKDSDGNIIESFEPGLIAYLTGDRSIEFNTPKATGGYAEFCKTELRSIAASFLITYELLTGDLSGVNYSSIKAGLVEFHRTIKILQKVYFIPMYLEPIWEWFVDTAQAAGSIPNNIEIKVEWTPPRLETIDRNKEALADLAEIKAGTRSLANVIAEKGFDPAEVLADIAETNRMLDEYKITLAHDIRPEKLQAKDKK